MAGQILRINDSLGTQTSIMPNFPKLETNYIDEESSNRAFRAILERVNDIGNVALLSGRVVTHTFAGTSEELVKHTLGRKPIGYIIVGTSAAATIHGRSHTSNYLKLTASAVCTADFWVF